MSNYIEYNDKIAFHPGYYIKEIIEESGLTQADFARKLDTTPKNISVLISGEQSLSIDMATKLSRMLGTTVEFWLNLQKSYDVIKAEIISDKLYEDEEITFKSINYDFFIEKYNLEDIKGDKERIKRLREYFRISSLKVLEEKGLTIDFRGYEDNLSQKEIVNTNAIVQTVINMSADNDIPCYDKKKFNHSLDYIVSHSVKTESEIKNIFELAGVRLMLLPCMKESKMKAFSKKINGRIVLAINDKWNEQNNFWEILLQEAWHILNNEFGILFRGNNNGIEKAAKGYALTKLKKSESI